MGVSLNIFILFSIVSFGNPKKFPPYVERCHKADPNVKQCYIKVMDTVKQHFGKGIPEFGLPPMDPLMLPKIALTSSNFNASFINLKIYELEQIELKDLTIDFEKNTLDFTFLFPKLHFSSPYVMQGRLLFLNLNSEGTGNANLTNLDVALRIEGERYEKDQQEYLRMTSVTNLTTKFQMAHLRFENLFPHNPELTEETNNVINENIMGIMEEMKPALDATMKQIIFGFSKQLFDRFPLKEFFPD